MIFNKAPTQINILNIVSLYIFFFRTVKNILCCANSQWLKILNITLLAAKRHRQTADLDQTAPEAVSTGSSLLAILTSIVDSGPDNLN